MAVTVSKAAAKRMLLRWLCFIFVSLSFCKDKHYIPNSKEKGGCFNATKKDPMLSQHRVPCKLELRSSLLALGRAQASLALPSLPCKLQ
jgi:hypothetical protein